MKLKLGTWLAIDPCYLIDALRITSEEWNKHVDTLYPFRGEPQRAPIEMSLCGKVNVIYFATHQGDGLYPVMKGDRSIGDVPVDSGSIVLIHLELPASTLQTLQNLFPAGCVISVTTDGELVEKRRGDVVHPDFCILTHSDDND